MVCPHCGGVVPVDVPERSIGRELSDLMADTGRSEVAAGSLLGSFLPPAPAEFLHPPVERMARGMRRNKVRGIEKNVMASAERFRVVDEKRRRECLAQRFPIGDGQEVTWGTASVAQHRKRIELLETNRKGIVQTQSRHVLAVELIEKTRGAKCLNDVPGGEEVVPVASAEVVAPKRSAARKPAASGNAAKPAVGKGQRRKAA